MRGLWLMALGVPIVAPACARVGEAHAPAAAMVAPATDVRLPAPLPGGSEDVWLSQVVYLVMPDRFQDGDPTNDEAGTPHCYDPSDPSKWHGGDIAGLRQRIPYLQELGVTAVWITPQYRQSPDRCGYHGYWADFASPDDGAVEPKMGTPAELSGLANDLHAAGIRLVLDMVVNHAGPAARVVAEQPTWFHDPATCRGLGDPIIYCPIGGKALPDFAQENPAVASYLSAMSVGWITRYGIDGIRMDTVKHVFPAYWGSSWLPQVRAASPGLFVVGEDFDESGTSGIEAYLNDGFDSLFDYPAYPSIVSTFAKGGTVDALASAVQSEIAAYGLSRALRMERFVDNHDNPRLTSQFPTGASDAEVASGFRLALGALFTLPGIPEVMWGDEIAMVGGKDPDNRRDMPSWAWSAETRAGAHPGMAAGDGQVAYAHLQRLIAIRKGHAALQRGSYEEEWRQSQNGGTANVLAFHRGAGTDHVIAAINVGEEASVSLPIANSTALAASDKTALAEGTVLKDVLGEGAPATVTVRGGVLPIALPAKAMGIYAVGP